jgi:hypothetical protein
LEKTHLVYWCKTAFAVVSALLGFYLGIKGANVVLFLIVMYLASYYFVKFIIGVRPGEVRGSLLLTGLFSFFPLALALWILLYTAFG